MQKVNDYSMTSVKMVGLMCNWRSKKEIEKLWNNVGGSNTKD